MKEYFIVVLASFIIGFIMDCIFGDPYGFPHSINLIGNSVRNIEHILSSTFSKTDRGERIAGIFLVVITCFLTYIISGAIVYGALRLNLYLCIAIQSLMIWQILAANSLEKESKKVWTALGTGDLKESRKALSWIVGRDTENLSEEGVIKGTVETIAENTSDGIIAPIIYIFLGGAPLGYLYKAINTMDSIVGYKNEKYLDFGRCAAKLDDIANFIPARITAIFMIMGSFNCGFDYKNAIKIFRRDRFNHASPNSAQTESVCAGALDIRLAGNAVYFGKVYEKPYIGDDIRKIEADDILKSHKIMYASVYFAVFIFVAVYLAVILNL